MNHIVNFSGGKDSTAMLLMMIERKMQIDKIIFVDTTKEFPAMYNHIEKVKAMIYPHEIETRSFNFDYHLKERVIMKGINKGARGYGWAGNLSRWCTRLKITEINRGLKAKETTHYIGIAVDEPKRLNRSTKIKTVMKYPLVEWGITETMALAYCYEKGFTWGGLYTDFRRVSCYCCGLQPLRELKNIYTKYPELWENMREMDKNNRKKFRADYTLRQLEEKFDRELNKETLFN